MALTSVVQSYLPKQAGNELQLNTNFAVPPYANCQPHNIPQMNSATMLDSPETTANMLLSSTGLSNATFLPSSTTVQNGFITPNANLNGTDAYHYVQTSLQPRLLNEFGQTARHPAIVGTSPLLSVGSHACLLPTPLSVGQDSLNQPNRQFLSTARSDAEVGSDVPTCMTDENTSAKTTPTHTEQSMCNPQSLVLIVRLLMSGKEVGSIIGKSGAKINISDGSSPERIVTITGTTKQIFVAFSLMSQKFEDDFTQGLIRIGDECQNCPPVTLRLLVPATQCGSIIGKGGSRIKDVRELTGASIQVASEALPTSTERTVTISGTAKSIAKCIRHLCEIFIESPVKGPVVPYRPKPAFVNQSVTCPSVSFSPTVVHPCLTSQNGTSNSNGLINTGSEFSKENGFPSNISTPGLVMTSATQAAVSKELAAAASQVGQFIGAFGYQQKYATMDNGSAVSPSAFTTTPDEPTTSNTGLVAVRHPAMITEMLTVQVRRFVVILKALRSLSPLKQLNADDKNMQRTPEYTISLRAFSKENGFPSNISTPGLVMTSATQAAVSKELAAAASQVGQFIGAFGYQQKYATMDNGSAVSPSAFTTTPDEPTTSNTGLVAVRHPAMITEMLTDPMQLSASLNYTDFMANSTPILGVLNSAYLGTGPISSGIINPLSSAFALPEFALNPGLLSFYTPQASNGLTTSTNMAYSGVGNLLKSSLNGTDENGNDSLSDVRAPTAGLTDIYPFLSLIQPNTYGLQPGNLGQPIATGPLPFVQNKASLLGLPAFPYPTVIGSNTGQLLSSNEPHFTAPDEPVIKEIIISNDLIGCIIGRGGTTVNEIRNISKAQIKISNCEDGAKERKISLSGPLTAVNLAHFLINNSIITHQQTWAFNVQLATAATALMTGSRYTNLPHHTKLEIDDNGALTAQKFIHHNSPGNDDSEVIGSSDHLTSNGKSVEYDEECINKQTPKDLPTRRTDSLPCRKRDLHGGGSFTQVMKSKVHRPKYAPY
ncbi:uncharacterized protein DEA37_0002335 [Paragonimus westermani]|uniref:K Homology domain-containing protein n=1 Tax=Paragonimus westermani TaxID=34504 RepID=A0A5J4NZU3_9TREM|nr:uncharacterized protein DEA37_0002335 [Paragonimus westermani]